MLWKYLVAVVLGVCFAAEAYADATVSGPITFADSVVDTDGKVNVAGKDGANVTLPNFRNSLGLGAADSPTFTGVNTTGGYSQGGSTTLFAKPSTGSLSVGASAAAAWINASATVSHSTAIGFNALAATPTSAALYNTAVGSSALASNTTGNQNTATGYASLFANTTGHNNTAFGWGALQQNTTGFYSIGIGNNALNANTTGLEGLAIGLTALASNTTGSFNVAVGNASMLNNNGVQNVGLGHHTLYYAQTSNYNTAIGERVFEGAALYATAIGNVGVGYEAGLDIANGSDYNVLVGHKAGHDITTGDNNIIIGPTVTTGLNITTGSNNILVGSDVSYGLTRTASNQFNIGNLIFATGLGTGTTLSAGNVGIGTALPQNRLEVSGNVVAYPAANFTTAATARQIKVGEQTNDATFGLALGYYVSGTFKGVLQSTAASVGADLLLNPIGGNVGVGHSAPSQKFHVSVADGAVAGLFSAASKSVRILSSSVAGFVEALDQTGITSYQPLILGGSSIFLTLNGTDTRILVDGVTNNVGVGTIFPQVLLQVGGTAGAFRVSNAFTDASNGEWFESSWSSNVLNLGTNNNGSGIARAISIRAGGVEAINVEADADVKVSTKLSVNVVNAGQLFVVGGTLTTAGGQLLNISPTLSSSLMSAQYNLLSQPVFIPTGASPLIAGYGIFFAPAMGSSAISVTTLNGILSRLDSLSGYSGVIGTGNAFSALSPSLAGSSPIGTYTSYHSAAITNGNGITTGTVFNFAFRSAGITASASTGGTIFNYGSHHTVPAGSGTGTNHNYGIFLTGNGGGSATSNYALYSDSTAPMRIGGLFQFLGSTSAFPALKRSSTVLQARLADDSAFAPLQGKLTTDTNYTAGDPATTGYLLVYDAAGTAYRVPALLN